MSLSVVHLHVFLTSEYDALKLAVVQYAALVVDSGVVDPGRRET